MASVPRHDPPNDAFARVSAALLAVWPTVQDQAAGLSAAERSLVLDECGSDYRPLVELLLDIGRQLRPTLLAFGTAPQSIAVWATMRAPLVHRLVATRYLQPDVARWAVDVWGRVHGVAPPPESPVAVPPGRVPAPGGLSTPAVTVSGGAARRPPTRPVVVSPASIPPAALGNVPSWAGGPVSPRVGVRATALAASGRLVVSGTTSTGPRYQPAERRAAVVLAILLGAIATGLFHTFRERAGESARPAEREDRTRRGDSLVAGVSDSVAPVMSVRDDSTPAPTRVAGAITGSFVDTGVGGRYVVTPHVRDVSGTETCAAVARALGAGRETLELVKHQPGVRTFELTTRAVTGTLDPDGWFTAHPRSGTTNNVNWQFRMRGRFGPNGFSAVSETYTEAILRWGRTQQCVVTAELTGRRLPG
ncbi:MAG: hypothetical protein ACK6DP_16965 [Gemmatimonas sp.]|uniref:hypothetical protein n=1 Tax=Gemmatimonas sp. TaxID=1962908 RepID=UPI00391EF7B1